jgi:ABC-2 type transport system permease protein
MRSLARYAYIARIAVQQQWAYRGELLLRCIYMVLFMSIFVALWRTALGATTSGAMAGYGLVDIAWYLAMTETVALSGSRVYNRISQAVKAGDLAYTLTRPLSYPLFEIAGSLGDSLPRFALNLLTAALVVTLGVRRIGGSPAGFIAFLAMAALSLVLDALIAALIGLTAFWIEEVGPIVWIYQKLMFTVGGLFLPLEFFPGWLRRIAEVLPFRFITNAPARAFVAFDLHEALAAVGGQIAYIVGATLVVALVWAAAKRRLVVHGG